MRTVINIAEGDLSLLDQISESRNMSREELVGEALSAYLNAQRIRADAKQNRSKIINEAFGAWADFPEDGLAYQERTRSEWER